jgi:hypothetical protein
MITSTEQFEKPDVGEFQKLDVGEFLAVFSVKIG